MKKPWSGRLATGLLASALALSPAMAADWIVSRVSGQVWITAPNTPAVRAAAGTVVPDGARFSTMRNSRAKLDRGAESILVSPDTTLTPSESFWGYTTILQQTGQIELEVETRTIRNVTVETPFLAAVAKGTRFTVTVYDRTADVQVAHGIVEVSDLRSGERADIRPGQKATVTLAEERGLEVTGGGQISEVEQGTPRTPQVKSVSSPIMGSPAVSISDPATVGSFGTSRGSVGAAGGRADSRDGDNGGKGSGAGKGSDGSGKGSNGGGSGGGNSSGSGSSGGGSGGGNSGGGGNGGKGGNGGGNGGGGGQR
jgi:hypothetical protein